MRRSTLVAKRNLLLTVSFLFSLLIILGATPSVSFAYHGNSHDQFTCTDCHLTAPDPAVDTSSTVNFVADQHYDLCITCHASSPSGAPPLQSLSQSPQMMQGATTLPCGFYGYGMAFFSYWSNMAGVLGGYTYDHYSFSNCSTCHFLKTGGAIQGTSSIRLGMSLGNADMCYHCHQDPARAGYTYQIDTAFTRQDNGINSAYPPVKLPKILVYDSTPAPNVDIVGGVLTLTASLYHEDDDIGGSYMYCDEGDSVTNGRGFYLDVTLTDSGGNVITPAVTYSVISHPDYFTTPPPVTEAMMLNKRLAINISTAGLADDLYTLTITPNFEGRLTAGSTTLTSQQGSSFEYPFNIVNAVAACIVDLSDANNAVSSCGCEGESCTLPTFDNDIVFGGVLCDSYIADLLAIGKSVESVEYSVEIKDSTGTVVETLNSTEGLRWVLTDTEGNLIFLAGDYDYTLTADITILESDGVTTTTATASLTGSVHVTEPTSGSTSATNNALTGSPILEFNQNSSVTLVSSTGATSTFKPDGSGGYKPPTNAPDLTLAQTANDYTITTKDGTVTTFDTTGKIAKITDSNLNTTLYTYNSNGQLTSVTDNFANVIIYTYNTAGYIETVTDPAGKTVTYEYNLNGNLITETHPDNMITSYPYDTQNRILTKTNCCGGLSYSYTYNSKGKVETVTDANGAITTYTYDLLNRVTSTIDALGNITAITRNRFGNVTKVVYPNGATTSYKYDGQNLKEVKSSSGAETKLTYDANNNVTSVTDPEDKVSSFVYDAQNNLVSTTNPLGKTTTFVYDVSGNLISTTNPFDKTTLITYDLKGLPLTVTAPNGAVYSYQYDGYGNVVKVVDAAGAVTDMTHNPAGSILSATDALTNLTTSTFDVMERLTSITDALGNTSSFTYNGLGSVTSVTDAKDRVTSYSYDPMQQLIAETNAKGDTSSYAYDSNGNLSTVINQLGEVLSYTYNSMGQVLTRTDFDGAVTSYAYDVTGRMTSVTKPDGTVILYAYDIMDRLTTITYPDATTDNFTFDPATGLLSSASNANGVYTFTYDEFGRLINVNDSFTGKNVGYGYDIYSRFTDLVYPTGRVVHYNYDTIGRLSSITNTIDTSP
ncbi:hypothetical protein ACFL2A_04810, partial [Thermodesulfobacteriota bacterium]